MIKYKFNIQPVKLNLIIMKKILSTLIIAFVFLFSNAQDYEITFAGAGASSTVDSVLIENLTQGTSIKLSGTDTLFLTKVTTGINSFNRVSNLPLTVYPNPFSSECKIEFSTQKTESITMRIFDLSGRLTASKVQLTEPGNHHFQIKGIPRGMYIIQVHSASLFQTAKVLSYNQNSANPEIKYQGFSTPVKTQLINKSATVESPVLLYDTNDDILFTATPGVEVLDDDGNFLMARGITMTDDVEIELKGPWKRAKMTDLVNEELNINFDEISKEELILIMKLVKPLSQDYLLLEKYLLDFMVLIDLGEIV